MEDNYTLQQLIEQKSFDELRLDEREMVLREISKDEYEARRLVVTNMKDFFHREINSIKVNAAIHNRVKAVMSQSNSHKRGILFGILMYRTPAYVSLAAIAILLIGLFWIFTMNENQKEKMDFVQNSHHQVIPNEIIVHDTITQIKEVEKIVQVPVIKYVQQKSTNENDLMLEMNEMLSGMENNSANGGIVPSVNFAQEHLKQQLQKIGQSANEQEQLNRFLVVAE